MELTESLIAVARLAGEPFLAWLDHRSVLYWPFLLSALLLAIVVWFGPSRRPLNAHTVDAFRRTVFAKEVWWHRSARADYIYYVVNVILHGALFGSLILSMDWVALTTAKVLNGTFGERLSDTDVGAARLALTLVFFLTLDFGRFIAHYALHHVPALWIVHKVHHSAEVLTPITSMRAHPIELIWMASVPAVTAGIPIGICIHLVGKDPGVILIGGLHVLIFAYSLIGNLRHSHIWLSYGTVLNHIFVSPAQHQIHHSLHPQHFGKNVGYALAIWDWLFRTLYVPRSKESLTLGLGDGTEPAYHSLRGMYLKPFADYLHLVTTRTP
ncbi:MAG: sterol desaturase family protein [Proteobacteria bacterium]|nr:sterol desaturase family protein [Pseudomonadota bacterium]